MSLVPGGSLLFVWMFSVVTENQRQGSSATFGATALLEHHLLDESICTRCISRHHYFAHTPLASVPLPDHISRAPSLRVLWACTCLGYHRRHLILFLVHSRYTKMPRIIETDRLGDLLVALPRLGRRSEAPLNPPSATTHFRKAGSLPWLSPARSPCKLWSNLFVMATLSPSTSGAAQILISKTQSSTIYNQKISSWVH